MSSLTPVEKRYLEKILGMNTGYVLDFTKATFAEFFKRFRIDIHSHRYQTYGTSKARKLRAFWERESDLLVALVLSQLLSSYVAYCAINGRKLDQRTLARCRRIVARLRGESKGSESSGAKEFLNKNFEISSINKLPVETSVAKIIESRLKEANTVLSAGAYLSVVFLCGSVLEAVLLGSARREPERFNRSQISPKDKSKKVKAIHEWKLNELIDVACDIGVINPDVKKFSHGLRDFRNYIHPQEQLKSGFTPDKHTAQLCIQTLRAALADVAGERQGNK